MNIIYQKNIDVCKVCEFMYICEDYRAYLKDQNNIFSKPLKI